MVWTDDMIQRSAFVNTMMGLRFLYKQGISWSKMAIQ